MAIRVLPHECGWLWSGCHGTCQSSGISRTQSTNGLAERYVAVVEEILRTCVNYKQTDWEEMTPHIEFVVNNQTKDTLTGLAPTKVELGIVPVLNT
jgi:hypothetical protein|eukprot:COSAG01_NODE_4158_length_5288_cov_24.181923_4_plen_96_part_00